MAMTISINCTIQSVTGTIHDISLMTRDVTDERCCISTQVASTMTVMSSINATLFSMLLDMMGVTISVSVTLFDINMTHLPQPFGPDRPRESSVSRHWGFGAGMRTDARRWIVRAVFIAWRGLCLTQENYALEVRAREAEARADGNQTSIWKMNRHRLVDVALLETSLTTEDIARMTVPQIRTAVKNERDLKNDAKKTKEWPCPQPESAKLPPGMKRMKWEELADECRLRSLPVANDKGKNFTRAVLMSYIELHCKDEWEKALYAQTAKQAQPMDVDEEERRRKQRQPATDPQSTPGEASTGPRSTVETQKAALPVATPLK